MDGQIGTRITELRSKSGVRRKRAREALVGIGRPAVPFLIHLMTDRSDQVRWEACKALVSIGDPAAATHLVAALRDEDSEVRWLAAEALIALGRQAVVPLMKTLEEHFDSADALHGVHHVLGALKDQGLLSKDSLAVLDKLSYLEPNSSTAFSADQPKEPVWKLARAAGLKTRKTGAGRATR